MLGTRKVYLPGLRSRVVSAARSAQRTSSMGTASSRAPHVRSAVTASSRAVARQARSPIESSWARVSGRKAPARAAIGPSKGTWSSGPGAAVAGSRRTSVSTPRALRLSARRSSTSIWISPVRRRSSRMVSICRPMRWISSSGKKSFICWMSFFDCNSLGKRVCRVPHKRQERNVRREKQDIRGDFRTGAAQTSPARL